MKAQLGSPRPPDGAVIDPSSGAWITLAGNPVWGAEPSVVRLLSALLLKGVEALDELDGSFALAFWNPGTGTLTLLRDRFGIEPLHYALTGGGVIFGSSARDVARARGTSPAISQQGLVEFLTFCYLPGTSTLFEGVLRVPPGSLVEWKPGGLKPFVRPWYRLSFANPWSDPEAALATRYRELLEASVIRRLEGGRPGVFLSGGMDSSTVATFMRGRVTGPLSSFSFRCGGSSFDESAYARELARELGTAHTEVLFDEDQALTIVEAIRNMDTPFCDIGIEVGTFILAKAAAGNVDYVLTGDGGDELWASHPVYAAQRIIQYYDRVPMPTAARRALVNVLDLARDSDSKRGLAVVLKRMVPPPDLPPALRHFRWRMYYTPRTLAALLAGPAGLLAGEAAAFQPVLESFEGYDGPDDGISPGLYSDYRTASGFYFSRLLLARSFGIEVGLPFYDRALVEFGARIPARLKLEGVERTKRLFRMAMEGVLPDVINHRKDKLGHSVPLKNWLREDGRLNRLVRETLGSPSFSDRGLFQPEVVHRMLDEHGSRRHNHSHRLWALFVLEHWMRLHLDEAS